MYLDNDSPDTYKAILPWDLQSLNSLYWKSTKNCLKKVNFESNS
jgi:hypothetical protein